MPKRKDIRTILVIGSGPIVIGQACEVRLFRITGRQSSGSRLTGCPGYFDPATIMTDPEIGGPNVYRAFRSESLSGDRRERPDALLPTLGGQTALNLAVGLQEMGVLERYRVEMIGANATAIATAEDRGLFRAAMTEIGLAVPDSGFAYKLEEALEVGERVGFPVIVRPSSYWGAGGRGRHHTRALEIVAGTGWRRAR